MPSPVRVEYAHSAGCARAKKNVPAGPLANLLERFLPPGPRPSISSSTDRGFAICFGWRWCSPGPARPRSSANCPALNPRLTILRFTEDKPNPLYRRICYTFAWGRRRQLRGIEPGGPRGRRCDGPVVFESRFYLSAYFPLYLTILALGAAGILPRVRRSTQGEGTERRYFYGIGLGRDSLSDAAVDSLENVSTHPRGRYRKTGALYVAALIAVGVAAAFGLLPRTRRILPGEVMVAD